MRRSRRPWRLFCFIFDYYISMDKAFDISCLENSFTKTYWETAAGQGTELKKRKRSIRGLVPERSRRGRPLCNLWGAKVPPERRVAVVTAVERKYNF